MTENAYNTTDPAKLFQLKQQEARAMLDIVRSIKPEIAPEKLIDIVVNAIQKQLDVNKLTLVVHLTEQKETVAQHRFPYLEAEDYERLDPITETIKINADEHPLFAAMGVEYILPVGHSPKPLGWFLIADFAESEAEIQNDLTFIETVGSILVIALQNRKLFEEKLAQETVRKELETARRIQQQSLPQDFQIHPRVDVYAVNVAHRHVGGDFFDWLLLNDHEIFVCIADVSGKGYGAALLVANLQSNLRSLAQTGATFPQMIAQLEGAVKHLTKGEHFITIFLGKVNLLRQEIEYINAGHNPPFVIRPDTVDELMTGCIPIGILPVPEVEIGKTPFHPGDMLFLYTDGVVEQPGPEAELLGVEPLQKLLKQIHELPAQEVGEQVLDLVWEHAQHQENNDDLSFLTLRFLK